MAETDEEFLVKKEVEVADARRIGLVVTNTKDKQKVRQLLWETDTSYFETIPPASSRRGRFIYRKNWIRVNQASYQVIESDSARISYLLKSKTKPRAADP